MSPRFLSTALFYVRKKAPIIGLVLGALVTPIAFFFGIASAGAGHGHYVAAKVLFPVTMLSTLAVGSITTPLLLLGAVQFPVYGWFIGSSIRGGPRSPGFWLPIAIHFLALALNFWIPNPNFS